MIVLSLFTLSAMTVCKVSNYTQVYNFYSTFFKDYEIMIDEGLLLLNAKIFFRGMPDA